MSQGELYALFLCNQVLTHCLKPCLAWTGSARPQQSNSAPEAVIPDLGHKVATFHRCSLWPGCAPSRTNVCVSLQSFLISFLTVWQGFLILLGWPFQGFVINSFFKKKSFNLLRWGKNIINSTGQQVAVMSANSTAQNRWMESQECPQQLAPYVTLQV